MTLEEIQAALKELLTAELRGAMEEIAALRTQLETIAPALAILSSPESIAALQKPSQLIEAVQAQQAQLAQLLNVVIQRVNQMFESQAQTQQVMVTDIERLRGLQAEAGRQNAEREQVLAQAVDMTTNLAHIVEMITEATQEQQGS